METLLSVRSLRVNFRLDKDTNFEAVKGISFDGNVINSKSEKSGLTYSNLDAVIKGTVKIPAGNVAVQTI